MTSAFAVEIQPAGIDSIALAQPRERVDLVLARHEPEDPARAVQRGVRERHSRPPLVDAGDRDVAIRDLEDGIAGHERGGVSVRAEPEVDEVELLGKRVRVYRGGSLEILGPDGHGRTSAAPPGGRLRWSCMRLRSGSPSGAMRSSTWKIVTFSHGMRP